MSDVQTVQIRGKAGAIFTVDVPSDEPQADGELSQKRQLWDAAVAAGRFEIIALPVKAVPVDKSHEPKAKTDPTS